MLTKYPILSKEMVRKNSLHISDGTEDKCGVSLTLGFIFSGSTLLFRYDVHLSVHQLSNHTTDFAKQCQFGETTRCCARLFRSFLGLLTVFVEFVVGLTNCTYFDTLNWKSKILGTNFVFQTLIPSSVPDAACEFAPLQPNLPHQCHP